MVEEDASRRQARLVDVAEAAGVSRGTASNVFNRPELVREEVRDRVLKAAVRLGYAGPDPKGRLLRAGKVGAIGVATARSVSYFFDDPFARVLMSGISAACEDNGKGIALVSAANDEKLAANIRGALVDGFILFCVRGGERLIELTKERQLPFVALELNFHDETVSSVGIDNQAGAALAARHIADLGHRRIGVLSVSLEPADRGIGRVSLEEIMTAGYGVAPKRADGYFQALAEFGIDATDVPIYETRNDDESARAVLEEMFAVPNPPTAILAMSDRIALAALGWLRQRDLRVPQDVSIIGFDGIPAGESSYPPLTTIAQPIEEMGRRAVRSILEFDGAIRQEIVDVELVVRGSTAPPKRAA